MASRKVVVAEHSAESATLPTDSALAVKPARYVCIHCRTALGSESVCDGGPSHKAVRVDTLLGREALYDEVWGPPSLRRRARELAKAGTGGVALDSCGSGFGDCSGCDGVGDVGEAAVFLLALVVVFFAVAAVYFVIKWIYEYIQRKNARLKPKGALLQTPRASREAPLTGVVKARILPDGVTRSMQGEIVATAMDYRATRFTKNQSMLRIDRSEGFEVRLDDGRLLKVRSGRARITGDEIVSDDPFLGRRMLVEAVPFPDEENEGFPLIPYDHVVVTSVHVGDRVEVRAPVSYDVGDGYRGGPTALVSDGLPMIRVLPARPLKRDLRL